MDAVRDDLARADTAGRQRLMRDAAFRARVPHDDPKSALSLLYMHLERGHVLAGPADGPMARAARRFYDDPASADAYRDARAALQAWLPGDLRATRAGIRAYGECCRASGMRAQGREADRLLARLPPAGAPPSTGPAERRATLPEVVAATVERAFWDCAREKPEMHGDLLTELRAAMLAVAPESEKAQIKDRFDVPWLLRQAEHGCLDPAHARRLMRYVGERIVAWQAPADAPAARAWLAGMAEADATGLVDFVRGAMAHLRVILARIRRLAEGGIGGEEGRGSDNKQE